MRQDAVQSELDALVRRVVQRIHERYDALVEKLRRDARDAQDWEQKTERRE